MEVKVMDINMENIRNTWFIWSTNFISTSL